MRILYVEDNPANLFLVQRVARMGNHVVINYSEGQTALDNFVQDKPDLILMDVQLPGNLTGLDVVKALREAGHKTPIIAVTAYAMIGDRERCLQVGCNGYIAKPLPVGELVDIIRQYENQMVSQPAPVMKVQPEKPAEMAATAAKSEAKPVAAQPEVKALDAASATEPEKLSASNPAAPAPEVKPTIETKSSVEPTEPEKPAELTVMTGSQNSPSTLSSKHQ